MTRVAECSCGALRATIEGEPVRVSVCHCHACQRRTGSAFGAQARFPADAVRIEGEHRDFERISDAGERRVFSFCPACGATVFYQTESEFIAVPLGALAGEELPAPTMEIWDSRRLPWVALRGDGDL